MSVLDRRSKQRAPARLAFPGLAALLAAAGLVAAASAAPAPLARTGVLGTAAAAPGHGTTSPVPTGVLYDDTGNASNVYYGGQGGHESLDDLHMTRGGTLDSLTFEYYDPVSETFSATVRIFGNPSGLDLGATPLIGTWTVSGLTGGRHLVSVPLTGTPSVTAGIWVGVQFTSTNAGLIVKDVPSVGTSHDLYLEDGGFYNFGGSPKANFALRVVDVDYFNLNVTTSGSGSVTKTPDLTTYPGGTQVQLQANPDPHWHFTGWGGGASGNTNPLTITMNANTSITAGFAIDSYALTVLTSGSGSVTKTPDQASYDYGASVSLQATPAPGSHFVGWSGDATGSTNPLPVTMDAAKTITATFAVDTYTLTVNTVGSGSVTKSPDLASYPYATPVTLTAIPSTGWTFQGFTGDIGDAPAVVNGTFNQLTLAMTHNRTVTATFIVNQYALDVAVAGNGSVTKTPDQAAYDHGSNVQLSATPATGWHFTGWSGNASGSLNPLTVTMDGYKSITANFAINTYTLSVITVGSGSVTKTPDQPTYNHGASVQLGATPAPGWHFVGWSGDASGATNPLTVSMTSNKTITATFAADGYTLSVSTVGSGSIAKAPNQATYTYNTPVQLTATPATGWSFTGWSGDASGTTNPVTVTMTGNKSVTATFTINSYTLAVTTVGSGSVTKAPNQASYTYGTSVQLAATPATGWSFTGWSGDASGATNPLTLSMTANKNITATFTINSYTLNVTVVGNGSVAKTPNQATYTYGSVVQLAATAAAGSHFVSWSGDATGTTTPTNVTMNAVRNVTATFALDVTTVASGTFESGLTGWNGYGGATLALVSPGQSSNNAAKLTSPVSNGLAEFGINDSPSLVTNTGAAGTHYRVKAWVRSDASRGAAKIRIREYLADVNQQTVYSPAVTLSTAWQQLTLDVYTIRASASLDLQVLDYPVAKGEVFLIDNITIDRLPSSPWRVEVATAAATRGVPTKALPAGVTMLAAAPAGGELPATLATRKLYDDTGNPANTYYSAQGGAEALDDLHMTSAGTVDTVIFEYYDPAVGGTLSATMSLYDDPEGLDLGARRIAGPFTITALPRGRKAVVVAVPHVRPAGSSVWVGVQFTSTSAGLVVNGTPSVGSSHDLYLENGTLYWFGGSPKANFGIRLVGTPTNVGVDDAFAGSISLAPPAPNPFRRGTTLSFTLQQSGPVRVLVLDAAGRRVRTLVDDAREAGRHSVAWSGRDDSGAAAKAGLYFVRLEAHGVVATRRLVLLP